MQPWRPRPGVFTAYEEKWRAERNLLVEKSNAAKALKARRPPRALNRRQSNLFENLTESRQQVWRCFFSFELNLSLRERPAYCFVVCLVCSVLTHAAAVATAAYEYSLIMFKIMETFESLLTYVCVLLNLPLLFCFALRRWTPAMTHSWPWTMKPSCNTQEQPWRTGGSTSSRKRCGWHGILQQQKHSDCSLVLPFGTSSLALGCSFPSEMAILFVFAVLYIAYMYPPPPQPFTFFYVPVLPGRRCTSGAC